MLDPSSGIKVVADLSRTRAFFLTSSAEVGRTMPSSRSLAFFLPLDKEPVFNLLLVHNHLLP